MHGYRLFLVAAYCAGLFWLSSNPSPEEIPDLFPDQDKVVHAVLYAGLAHFPQNMPCFVRFRV